MRDELPREMDASQWLLLARDAERRGELLLSYDLARRGLKQHPNDVRLRHRAVLSLARSGATGQARRMLDALGLDETGDEEIAALWARLAKDHALHANGEDRVLSALDAALRYERIHRRTGGYYPAINAATLHLVGGEPGAATDLARRVLASLTAIDPREAERDYYVEATEAEALLLLGEPAAAAEAITRAERRAERDLAAMATTRRQLRVICEIKGIDPAILAPLTPPPVAHYTGHMFPQPQGEGEASIAARIHGILEQRGVATGYGSLACGADILFAEALLSHGAELHVVLPFDEEEFKQISVAPGGPAWLERFRACLAAATTVTHATEDAYLGEDRLFAYASQLAMGLALVRSRSLDAEVFQMALWDGRPALGEAGAAVDVERWRSTGRTTYVIECPSAAAGRASSGPEPSRRRRVVRAMLFGDVQGFSRLREAQVGTFVDVVMGAIADVLDRHSERILHRNTWGDGVFVVMGDASAAARCALDLQTTMGRLDLSRAGLPSHLGLRVGGHLGPVIPMQDPVLRREGYFGTHVNRAARVEPATPVGAVYVTEPFAAQLALLGDDGLTAEYVGHTPTAKGYGDVRMYVLKE